MELFADWSRRRKLVAVLLLFVIGGAVLYWEHVVAGTMFALGTQDLSVRDDRFGAASDQERNMSEQGVQANYTEAINALKRKEFYVTQKNGTEAPFKNELYDEKRPGIYVDVVSGEPLFSSKAKFASGTGWPSFTRPIHPEAVVERRDPGPLGIRVEIASRHARSHLGHLFRDGPPPRGLRYCMNSAALEFIPAWRLEDEGYGMYTDRFNATELTPPGER